MPTYEYICDACKTEFEQFQSIKADPVKVCPACGKEKVRRKISGGAAILFKGGGFYETDYRSEKYKQAAKADADAAKPAGEAKSDAKGQTKAETKSTDTTRNGGGGGNNERSGGGNGGSGTDAKSAKPSQTEHSQSKSEPAKSDPTKSATAEPSKAT